jgi:acetyl esterase/lipase
MLFLMFDYLSFPHQTEIYYVRQGYGVCLIEYRRVGHEGGGWPGTNNDVLEGLWKLRSVLSVDYGSTSSGSQKSEATAQQSVVLLGHSAGGTLALWIASKLNKLSEGVPIALCVAVAPIGDLNEGSRRKLSDEGDAINLYMGCEPSATSPDCPYR